jgi:hypothetical protein
MNSLPRLLLLLGLLLVLWSTVRAQSPVPIDANALVQKIQGEITAPLPPADAPPDPTIPHGELLRGSISDPALYPGTYNSFQVYVPAQYDPAKPACLLIRLDGLGPYEAGVLDELIAKKEVPIIIAVGITPGTVYKAPDATGKRAPARYNRSYEFDSMNDHFPAYVLNDVLPAVEKLRTTDGRAINISPDGNDHAVTGSSTGGIGSFTLAWRRPDQFTRVYDIIGTFVSMRGGHEYPALIRKTDPKPIRIFLEDGSIDAWNPLFGSWYDANLNMESALTFAGYDVAHAWGTHGHDGRPGMVALPDVLRWLWRDYPAPIKAGISHNSTLQEITLPGEGWQKVPETFPSVSGLAANQQGQICLSDGRLPHLLDQNGADLWSAQAVYGPSGQAFGPDGKLYGLLPGMQQVVTYDPKSLASDMISLPLSTRPARTYGRIQTVTDGITGHALTVTHDGTLYVTEPGEHTDMPSQIWKIAPNGEKKVVDQGLSAASGIALSPDGSLLYVAENSTKWIYSYVVQPDGTLTDKQPFYWLHMTDIPNNSGAEDLAVDTHGNLYVATRMGIQVCDQNGRVRAILPLPTPCGPVRSLCFGGDKFDVLYATDGTQLFKRTMKVPGFPPWAAPITVPSQGPG